MRLGVGLVVAMGLLALISSGVVDGLGDRVEALSSSPSAGGAQRVASADVSGRAHVLDGDTIEVGGVRVRLQCLHCPEAGERGGSAATSAMRGLTSGHHVSCSLTGQRSHERMIGTCYAVETDLTAAIIRQGVCARCPRYEPWRAVPAGAARGWAVAWGDAGVLLSIGKEPTAPASTLQSCGPAGRWRGTRGVAPSGGRATTTSPP